MFKEELDAIGCQEVSLSFVTSESLWDESGRSKDYSNELLRFQDRKSNKFVLSATNEEAMVDLVKQTIQSYKQLSVNLYQINLKFRDERRARFGLLRSRKFMMKEGYSFHTSKEEMEQEFDLMEKTYSKIFTRLGIDFRIVEANSGQINGNSRIISGLIEQNHDEKVCIWTEETQAFDYHIIISNINNKEQVKAAEKIYESLVLYGHKVLLDDRKDRFGTKMNDFELIAIGKGIIVGKNIEDDLIEIIDRKKCIKNT